MPPSPETPLPCDSGVKQDLEGSRKPPPSSHFLAFDTNIARVVRLATDTARRRGPRSEYCDVLRRRVDAHGDGGNGTRRHRRASSMVSGTASEGTCQRILHLVRSPSCNYPCHRAHLRSLTRHLLRTDLLCSQDPSLDAHINRAFATEEA